jgi:hypothetical protein
MRNYRTSRMFYLIDVLQTRHGPYPRGRPAFVTWLTSELDQLPDDDDMTTLIAKYPAHLATLPTKAVSP